MPHFIGIGAPKSATTWFMEVLRGHPEIYVSDKKEIVYFCSEKNYARGDAWYLSNFSNAKETEVAGEFSVDYLRGGDITAERIYKLQPSVKLILIVRNPVERAISHYKWLKQLGKTTLPLSEAIVAEPSILEHGFYYALLTKYLKFFSLNNILIIKHEEILKNPSLVQEKTFEFLGVDDTYRSPLQNKRISKTINPRLRLLENLRIRTHKYLRKNNKEKFVVLFKRLGLSRLYRRLNDKHDSDSGLGEHEINALKEVYKDDMKSFFRLTGVSVERD